MRASWRPAPLRSRRGWADLAVKVSRDGIRVRHGKSHMARGSRKIVLMAWLLLPRKRPFTVRWRHSTSAIRSLLRIPRDEGRLGTCQRRRGGRWANVIKVPTTPRAELRGPRCCHARARYAKDGAQEQAKLRSRTWELVLPEIEYAADAQMILIRAVRPFMIMSAFPRVPQQRLHPHVPPKRWAIIDRMKTPQAAPARHLPAAAARGLIVCGRKIFSAKMFLPISGTGRRTRDRRTPGRFLQLRRRAPPPRLLPSALPSVPPSSLLCLA